MLLARRKRWAAPSAGCGGTAGGVTQHRMLTAAPLGCPCTTSGTTWAGSRWPASDCRPGGTALELRAALQTQHPVPQRQAHCHRHAAHTLWHGSSKPPACTQVRGGTTRNAYQHKSGWSRLGISLATPSTKLPNSIWIRECVVQLPAKVHKLLASSCVGHPPRVGGGFFHNNFGDSGSLCSKKRNPIFLVHGSLLTYLFDDVVETRI